MMPTPLLWLGKRLAYVALALLGAGLVLFVYTRIGDTAITPGVDFGMYTYPPGDCQESDEDAEDPINVVFYDDAAAENLDYYFDEYHGWGDNGGESQYFNTNGNCHEMDGQPSSNQIGQSRYHCRGDPRGRPKLEAGGR